MWHRNQYHLKIKKRNCGSQTEPNRTMAQFGCEVGFTLVILRLDQSQKSEPNKLFLMFLHICFFFHLESTCPRWQIHSSVHWLVQTRPWCWSTVTVKCLTPRKTFQQSKTYICIRLRHFVRIKDWELLVELTFIFAQTAPTHGDVSQSYFTLRTKSRASAASVSPVFVSETAL